MYAPRPVRAAADAFVEQRGAARERMVIHRTGTEAWFTIRGDASCYDAILTIRDGEHVVDISPQRPAPHISKRLGRETLPAE